MRKTKDLKLSLAELAQHQIFRSFREMLSKSKSIELISKLYIEKEKIKNHQQNLLVALVLSSIWIASTDLNSITIKINYFNVEFKKSYVIFVSSALMLLVYTTIFSFIFIDRTIGNMQKLINKSDPLAIGIAYDSSALWGVPFYVYPKFFERTKFINFLSILNIFLFLLPIFIILISIYISIFIQCISLFGKKSQLIDLIVASSSILLLLYCAVHWVVCSIKFKIKKDTNFIRWIFLCSINAKDGFWPKRVEFWIDSKK
ncbi:MAG: hypothetical protein FD175_2595 [Beijerinckiaceae bacterium]|nr:MAG: hypothetical protein FD175_2595 [Beijerinckiaceae bacterium]